MGKKANRTVIGAFVVGAVALGVAGLIVFGSGKILQERTRYVMFFDGSLKGLQAGSAVVMNGVKIGEVTDIRVVSDPAALRFYSPVYIEIEPNKIFIVREGKAARRGWAVKNRYALYKPLMEKGMKAQLVLQSFVTGQLWINLGFYPDKPVRLVGLVKDVPEIPTVPTTLEELQKTVESLPLKEIAGKLDNVVTGIDRIVNSPELQRTLANLERTSGSIDRLAKRVDSHVEPLSADVRQTLEIARGTLGEANKTLASARGALEQAEKTLSFTEGVPRQVADSLLATLSSTRSSLEESRKALLEVQGLASQSTQLEYEAGSTLKEMKSLSRSIRSLTDYLERHPESLIRGKSPDTGDAR
jgi:paraquat-inducible protein B